jgi:PAS domain S-box-containing protein
MTAELNPLNQIRPLDSTLSTLHGDELALLIDSVEDYAIFSLTPTGMIRSWNRGALRIMGYTANEIVGQHFSAFYRPEDIEDDRPGRELRVAASEGRIEDEGWRVRKDGQHFWANTVITALLDRDRTLRGFAKVTRDLTIRREAEERLKRSETLFRTLVESVKDYAIFMLDAEGCVATWNAGAEKMKQYKPREIIGRHFSTFYPEDDIRAHKPERELEIATREGSVEDEGWRLRKDGTRFWANVVITAVRDDQGRLTGFAKVTRDITERRRGEEAQRALLEQREQRLQAEEEKREAEAAYQAAQEANRAKDEFLMMLSHELRTPMTAIVGWSKLLTMMHPDEATLREAIDSISRSASLQARLIDEVLDVSRIVAGKLLLNVEIADVVTTLQSAAGAVRAAADAKSITITDTFAPNLGSASFDSVRLQQVVCNLLSNAVKFTPGNGHIVLAATRTSSELQITVTDSGEGIDPRFLPHIFERFRQGETPSTRSHGGLGLGLSIVRHLVEAHGGNVTAESEGRGKGAKFVVTLPIRAVSTNAAVAPPTIKQAIDHGRQLNGYDVVVVDDDRDALQLISATLRHAGASVATANCARQTLELLANKPPPNLILTDIAMPAVDGFALLRSLRERPELRSTCIVALTAFPSSATGGEEEGFDAYLRKPIDPVELTMTIRGLLRTTP